MITRKKRLLEILNKKLIFQTPLTPPKDELFTTPKRTEILKYHFKGTSVNRTIIYLRSDIGCEHGVKTGGCTGCGHWRAGTAGKTLNIPNMYVEQYLAAIKDNGLNPVMCLYNEGSMLNPKEVPFEQLVFIVQHMANHGVKKLILESRSEHIKENILVSLKKATNGMEIEIGMGLESANTFIRNELFLKSITLKSYEKAVNILGKYGFNSLAYVLIKPPFLNEAQAIYDSINTVKYAFSVGTEAVCLEPFGVAPYTITQMLYDRGFFQPPKLWSVVKVVEETLEEGEVRIGGFQFEPRPTTVPQNCEHCTDNVLTAFSEYNHTLDIDCLTSLMCSYCYPTFLEEIETLSKEIDEAKIYNKVSQFVEENNFSTQ